MCIDSNCAIYYFSAKCEDLEIVRMSRGLSPLVSIHLHISIQASHFWVTLRGDMLRTPAHTMIAGSDDLLSIVSSQTTGKVNKPEGV